MTPIKAISIPKPCHQAWQQMTLNNDGRHCQHCCKTVTDFTQMNNADIIRYLSAQQHTCGRFEQHQLDSLNYHLYIENLQPAGWWKKVTIGLGLMSQLSAGKVEAQVKPVPVYQVAGTSSKAHTPFILGKVMAPLQQNC